MYMGKEVSTLELELGNRVLMKSLLGGRVFLAEGILKIRGVKMPIKFEE